MAYTEGTVLRTAFDTYTIQSKRGEGRSGEVFEVLDSEGVPRALKVLNGIRAGQHGLRRSRDEFNFGFRSTHPNIAPLLDCGITGTRAAFYVMPLYRKSLKDWIEEGIPTENLLRFFGGILDGLEAAHLHGIWHGGLKPENIFASEDGKQLLIADFGIAKLLQAPPATASGSKKSRAKREPEPPPEPSAADPYTAPELRAGGSDPAGKGDVYSLGMLLRVMFTGQTAMGLGHKDISDVAPGFAYLDWTVGRMINPEPSRRLSVTEVKRELIARGHEFLSLQRLNALKNEILREKDVDDPLLRNPIAIQSVDFKGETLYLTLSSVPPPNWVNAFHAGEADGKAGGHGPTRYVFLGKLAHMRVARGLDPQQLLEAAKRYVDAANRLYLEKAKDEHLEALEAERQSRRAQIAAEERRHSVLSRLRL